jgi:hypothetical protein
MLKRGSKQRKMKIKNSCSIGIDCIIKLEEGKYYSLNLHLIDESHDIAA